MKNLLVGIGFIFEDVTALELKEKLDQQWQDMYQKPRKRRKVLDLDNDLAAITHDEEEKGIDHINDNGDVNDNDNAHEEVVEEHAVAATELVEVGIKEGHSSEEVAPSLKFMKAVQLRVFQSTT
jgi:uncharacterized protein YeeX (DUF496 family)